MYSDLIKTKRDIEEFAKIVASAVVREQQPSKDLISTNEAYRCFERRWVTSRAKAGLLKPHRSGEAANSKVLYSRTECMALLEAERQQEISFKN